MNYRERMKEYLKEPDEYSSQYGKWGALNREQRDLIKRLLNEMDNADEVIKHQFFEIERLNTQLEDLEKLNNANYQSFIETNKIIIELEKWLDKKEKLTFNSWNKGIHEVQRKLQELKEVDKE